MMEDMGNPLVSVVITTHNRKNILKYVIKSVLNQTYKNIEIIVVDDKSTDGTEEIVKSINGKIVYIYISKEESKGGNYARNIGLKKATGNYIAYLDDDDFWMPEKIAKQVEHFQKNSNAKMVYCFRYFCYKNKYCWLDFPKDASVGDVSKITFKKIITSTSTMMFDRESLLNIGGFDEDLHFWQETELMMRFSQKYPIECVQEPLVLYTISISDPNKLSNKYEEWKLAIRYIEEKHANIIEQFSEEQKKQWKLMIYRDAINRCNTNRLKHKRKKLYKEVCLIAPFISNQIKKFLNYQATSKSVLTIRMWMAKCNLCGCCMVERINK